MPAPNRFMVPSRRGGWSARYANGSEKATAVGANLADAVSQLGTVTDRTHGLLMDRADALMACTENSPEEAELAALTDVIEAYERQRWPDGKVRAATANARTAANQPSLTLSVLPHPTR